MPAEALIGEVYLEKIIAKLHATLSETKSLSDAGDLEPLISFICDVASTFFSSVQDCLLLLSAEELLLTVFQLTAVSQRHSRLSGRSALRQFLALPPSLNTDRCCGHFGRIAPGQAEEGVRRRGPVVGPTL